MCSKHRVPARIFVQIQLEIGLRKAQLLKLLSTGKLLKNLIAGRPGILLTIEMRVHAHFKIAADPNCFFVL